MEQSLKKISRGQDRRKVICLTKNGYFSNVDFVLSSCIGWCTQGSNRIVELVQCADKICVLPVIMAIPKSFVHLPLRLDLSSH